LALQRFGIKAEETVFIDDNPNNVAAANALGITGILFEGKENLEEKLLTLIHHRGASVNDGIG
jgi:2-haloacid dehalogenase